MSNKNTETTKIVELVYYPEDNNIFVFYPGGKYKVIHGDIMNDIQKKIDDLGWNT